MNPLKFLSRGGAGVAADENFENTVLLLHGDGTNGAQNNTFLDSSTNNFTITRNGNTTQGSFSPFSKPDGAWGNYFDGSGDYFSTPSTPNLSSGAWTIEAFVYPTNTTTNIWFDSRGNDTGGLINNPALLWSLTTSKFSFRVDSTNTDSTNTFAANTWHHVALVRNSNTVTLYVNGVSEASVTTTTTFAQAYMRVGAYGADGSLGFAGYLSNLRVVIGTAVYTSAFTPPSAPLTAIANTALLTCQSNRFVDNSTNAYALTAVGNVKVTPFSPFPITTAYDPAVNGGSAYVGGASTYLSLPSSTPLSLDSTQWEVSCWIYPTSWVNGQGIWGASNGGGAQPKVACQISDGATTINLFVDGAVKLTATVPALNQWTHLLISRSTGGTGYLYYNGVLQDSDTVPTAAVTASFQWFTNGEGGTSGMYGYMAGARVLDSTSNTGSSFSVPTAPPTAVSGTECLCNFTNAGIFDNTGFNNLETVGNGQIDTTTKKYGTGSMEFDGSGDYLVMRDTPEMLLGTGDFTIEMWINVNGNQGSFILDFRPSGTNGVYVCLYVTGATFRLFVSSADRITSSSINYNQWYHLALTRSGTSTKMFLDGVQTGSTYTDSNNYLVGSMRPIIATSGSSPGGAGNAFNGYIDDLRITKGVARYTTTFTPPDKSFPDIGE